MKTSKTQTKTKRTKVETMINEALHRKLSLSNTSTTKKNHGEGRGALKDKQFLLF
jgi:hypothetical protein